MKKDIKEIKIAVFMGGISNERDISLKSGKAVLEALSKMGLDVISVDITSDKPEYIQKLIISSGIDFVFIALHGKFGEDGTLQKILEEMHIPYTGSDSSASHLAMDKIASKELFLKAGLKVPDFLALDGFNNNLNLINAIKKEIGFPLVVKPSTSGSSIGLSLIDKEKDLKMALSLAKRFSNSVLIEQFIKGRELTVGILDDEPLAPIEIVTDEPFFNFQAKYESANTRYIVPAEIDSNLSNSLKQAGIKAHKSLGCRGFSRVDMLLGEKGDIYVLEVNAIPGLTQRSLLPKAANLEGIDFSKLCLKIINSALL
ncbi:MAG: D-alanine--D-alanine ligase [Candidatus Omnitrophota bacterium]